MSYPKTFLLIWVIAAVFLLVPANVSANTNLEAGDKLYRQAVTNTLDLFIVRPKGKKNSCRITNIRKRKLSVSNRRLIIIGDIQDVYPYNIDLKNFINTLPSFVLEDCQGIAKYPLIIERLDYDVYARVNQPRDESGALTPDDLNRFKLVASGTYAMPLPTPQRRVKARAPVSPKAFSYTQLFADYRAAPQVLINGLRAGSTRQEMDLAQQAYLAYQQAKRIVAQKASEERKRQEAIAAAERQRQQELAAEERRRRDRIAAAERQKRIVAAREKRAKAERDRLASLTPKQREQERAKVRILNLMDQIVTVDSGYWLINRYQRGSMRNLSTSFIRRRDGGFNIAYRADYSFNRNGNGWVTVVMNGDQIVCIEYWDARCRNPYGPSNPNYNGLLLSFVAAAAIVAANSD